MRDTIFALATSPGRAAVAVVRLSGPRTQAVLVAIGGPIPPPRRAALRVLHDPRDGDRLDQALVLWFPGPSSFTGEDQGELHLHGGRAVIEAVLAVLSDLGLRLAEAGEFTRRAFENGKLDLAEAEGVADLIDAETQGQRRQALDQLSGALRGREVHWRTLLVNALSLLEAGIDFPDEQVPGGVVDQALVTLGRLRNEIAEALQDVRGERIREGFRIAIVGRPNAGKSSLLNALARRDAAIVTPLAGTTRDIIEVSLDISGYRVTLADTAGLRDAVDVIEAEGLRRGKAWAEAAALRLFVLDASTLDGAGWDDGLDLLTEGDVLVLNKMDLAGPAPTVCAEALAVERRLTLVRASAGLDDVAELDAVLDRIVVESFAGSEAPTITRLRHRRTLVQALEQLDRALEGGRGAELAAEDVRLAAHALARLSGRINAEDVLDGVFSTFCIGK